MRFACDAGKCRTANGNAEGLYTTMTMMMMAAAAAAAAYTRSQVCECVQRNRVVLVDNDKGDGKLKCTKKKKFEKIRDLASSTDNNGTCERYQSA